MYKKAQSSNWITDEVDVTQDLVDWKDKLDSKERSFLSRILAVFAIFHGIANDSFAQRFSVEVRIPEAKYFYGLQMVK
jgi:ribonucleoside-diphosphate reductase subunit M2